MRLATLHITTVSTTDEALAVAILLLTAGAAISLIAVHLLDRGVNPVSMAISDYGAREHAWFYRLAAVWLGLAGLLAAVVLGDAMFPKPSAVILALLVFAAARWAITIFPTDIEGEEQTSIGRSHLVLAVAAFAAIAFAAAAFAPATSSDPFWNASRGWFSVLGWAMPIVAVVMGASRVWAAQVFGLIERLFYLLMFAWFASLALVLLGA